MAQRKLERTLQVRHQLVAATSVDLSGTFRSTKGKSARDGDGSSWYWTGLSGTALALGFLTIEKGNRNSHVTCSAGEHSGEHPPDEASVKPVAKSTERSSAAMVDVGLTDQLGIGSTGTVPPTSFHEGQERSVVLSLASEYNANGPIEDRYDVQESLRGDFFAAVYDGHGGWQAAEFARKRLSVAAQTELNSSLAKTTEQIKGALTHAFLRVEREYLYRVKAAFDLGFGAVAKTGACAIMALIREDKLFVANAGDCRAVLARRRRQSPLGWGSGVGDGAVEVIALSNDHNAREKSEQEKLRRLHPSEEDIVKCKRSSACYVKGRLQVRNGIASCDQTSRYRCRTSTHVSPDDSSVCERPLIGSVARSLTSRLTTCA